MRNRTIYRPLTEKDRKRFAKFLLRDPESGCLLFTGGLQACGHGQFWLAGKMEKAHRVAWWAAGHTIPIDWELTHHCPGGDRPNCCEINHLKPLTLRDHRMDRCRKGQEHGGHAGLPFGARRRPRCSTFQAQASISGTLRVFGSYPMAQQASEIARFVKDVALGVRFLMEAV